MSDVGVTHLKIIMSRHMCGCGAEVEHNPKLTIFYGAVADADDTSVGASVLRGRMFFSARARHNHLAARASSSFLGRIAVLRTQMRPIVID